MAQQTIQSQAKWQCNSSAGWFDYKLPDSNLIEKNWITFSVHGGSSTMQLTIGSHTYSIDFLKKEQVNIATQKARKIQRVSTGHQAHHSPHAQQPAVWQCDLEGTWTDYSPQMTLQIEACFNGNGQTQFQSNYMGTDYLFDVNQMIQTNVKTGYSRQIRRTSPPSLPSSPSASNDSWQCLLDGSWRNYDRRTSQFIESQYAKNNTKFQCKCNGHDYTMDLQQMTQTNDKTGKSRQIKRSGTPSSSSSSSASPSQCAVWQCMLDGSWQDYDYKTNQYIESQYKSNQTTFQCTLHGNKYTIDIQQMTQTNVQTGNSRKIQRDVNRSAVPNQGPKPSTKKKSGAPDPATWTGPRRVTFDKTIKTLYHVTDPKSADLIMKDRKMIRGKGGMLGGGIYFAETPQDAKYKAEHKGRLITAKVLVGKEKIVQSITQDVKDMTFGKLQAEGFDSVHAPKGGGKGAAERAVYNFDQVCIVDCKPY